MKSSEGGQGTKGLAITALVCNLSTSEADVEWLWLRSKKWPLELAVAVEVIERACPSRCWKTKGRWLECLLAENRPPRKGVVRTN